MNINVVIYVLFMTLTTSASSYASDNLERIDEQAEIPDRVQQTIVGYLKNGKIEEIRKNLERKELVVYEVKGKRPTGKRIEMQVDENGRLMEIK